MGLRIRPMSSTEITRKDHDQVVKTGGREKTRSPGIPAPESANADGPPVKSNQLLINGVKDLSESEGQEGKVGAADPQEGMPMTMATIRASRCHRRASQNEVPAWWFRIPTVYAPMRRTPPGPA